MDLMSTGTPSSSGPTPMDTSSSIPIPGQVKEKKAKSKKHKKHHKHDRHFSDVGGQVALDGCSSNPESGGGLKLRIKVGSEGDANLSGFSGHKKKKKKDKKKRDKEKKHRHHHKEKRKRDHVEAMDTRSSYEDVPPAKRITFDESSLGDHDEKVGVIGQPAEVQPVKESVQKKPLHKLFDYILPMLEKRDPKNFFAFPVSDKFAPGYSQIIKDPMDFSTMRKKLDNGEYSTLDSFKQDFELMCTNAMTYNTQETIYYKTAKKLLSIGQKLLTQKKLMPMREQLPFMEKLTMEELGFDILEELVHEEEEEDEDDDDARDVSRVLEDIKEVIRRPPGRFEAIPDDLTSQEILDQARKAAKAAADKLKLYKPYSKMGFLRQSDDGSTSLSFLPGGSGVVPGTDKDRPVLLGSLIGKVKQGSGSVQGFKEDRRNLVKPVHPLYYGAFSSHGPNYDSTFANLTKEESDLVYTTYGDEVGVQYAESILNYSRNCNYAMFIVDHLLDILTGNEHRQTSKYIEEQKALRKEHHLLDAAFKPLEDKEASGEVKTEEPVDINFESLKSLQEEGIDMSFLDSLKTEYETLTTSSDSSNQLQKNANLIEELKNVQMDRLKQTPPQHFAHIAKPGEKEVELATQIQNNLKDITRQIAPKDIVPSTNVRKMLGLPLDEKAKQNEPNERGIPIEISL